MFHKFLILCPCKVFVTFRSKVTPLESVKFQAPIYLNTRKKAKSEEPFFETLGVSKKVSCYESSLVVCLASLETPLSLFTSWIMTNFVTVEKTQYISHPCHIPSTVWRKKIFLSFSLLFLAMAASTVVIYALWKYCRLSLDHNKRFVVGHVTTMSAIKAQSERRVCDSTKGRRKVWKSRGGQIFTFGGSSLNQWISTKYIKERGLTASWELPYTWAENNNSPNSWSHDIFIVFSQFR